MWAIELVSDTSTRAPLPPARMTQIRHELLDGGPLPLVLDNRIHVTPPAVIPVPEAERGIGVISDVLSRIQP